MLNGASLFKKSYMKKVVLSIGDCFWYFQDEYILVFCIVESATEQLSFSYVHCVFCTLHQSLYFSSLLFVWIFYLGIFELLRCVKYLPFYCCIFFIALQIS